MPGISSEELEESLPDAGWAGFFAPATDEWRVVLFRARKRGPMMREMDPEDSPRSHLERSPLVRMQGGLGGVFGPVRGPGGLFSDVFRWGSF